MKKRVLASMLALTMVTGSLMGCGSTSTTKAETSTEKTTAEATTAAASSDDPIVVGSKDFTESIIIGEIYALALEDAGIPVERKMQIGSQIIHDSLVNGEIDLYPEYTGTGLVSHLGEDPIYDSEECYEKVKSEYESKFHLTWLDHSTVNDSEGLAVSKSAADTYSLATISDVWANASNLVLAGNGEFFEAAATYPRLMEIYGNTTFKDEVTMDHNLTFTAAKNGEVDVISVYTTEGSLAGDDFVILKDDKACWPPYFLAPVIRDDALAAHPEAADVLNKVTATFTDKNVISMNASVDIDGADYEDVAADYYDSIKDSL